MDVSMVVIVTVVANVVVVDLCSVVFVIAFDLVPDEGQIGKLFCESPFMHSSSLYTSWGLDQFLHCV